MKRAYDAHQVLVCEAHVLMNWCTVQNASTILGNALNHFTLSHLHSQYSAGELFPLDLVRVVFVGKRNMGGKKAPLALIAQTNVTNSPCSPLVTLPTFFVPFDVNILPGL